MDLLAALQQSVDAARTARGETTVTRPPASLEAGAVHPSEWYGIGSQAQTALIHAYWAEQRPDRPETTAASIGMPGMIRDGNVTVTPEGPRLTDRGRAVLAQGHVFGVDP